MDSGPGVFPGVEVDQDVSHTSPPGRHDLILRSLFSFFTAVYLLVLAPDRHSCSRRVDPVNEAHDFTASPKLKRGMKENF